MAHCTHTGLDTRMCGHCNGSHPLEVPPFAGRRPEDEHPRKVALRGKVEWRGKGESIMDKPAIPSSGLMAAVGLPPHSCTRAPGFSTWGRENLMRSLLEGLRGA